MTKFMWILGATCLGVAGYLFFSDSFNSQLSRAGAGDTVDEFGELVGGWGTRNRVTGTGSQLGGRLKQGFGRITGDEQLEAEGVFDETAGKVKDTAGQAAHAVSDTISNLNR